MLEACVEVRLQTKVHYDRVVMAVDVCVHSVQSLEDLQDERLEGLWERHT